jgi:predicted HD phosphohydrolase
MTLRAHPSIDTVVELLALLDACHGAHEDDDRPREAVDLLAHGLQCAEVLSATRPDDVELQLAGLVHDVGHVLVPGAADRHGVIAREALQRLLGERIAALVELHVPAKRYLVTVEPAYDEALSDTSRYTLELQGGPMTPAEIDAFLRSPFAADALVLRDADERAKVPGAPTRPLSAWRGVLDAQASGLR